MASAHSLPPRGRAAATLRMAWLGLILCAYALRVWGLDRLGLAYDEAATALMAQAAPLEIVRFHWQAPFEHPPLWILLMHSWSGLAGQSEAALRLLPAYAGVLLVPLLGRLVRAIWPERPALAWLSGALVALSPVLVYYSQEARMYSLVVACAVLVALLSLRLASTPAWRTAALLMVSIWAMLGLHYFSALVLVAVALYFGAVWLTAPRRALPGGTALFATYALGGLPLLLWMAFAPGFQETLAVVLQEEESRAVSWQSFFYDLWRELSFGSIRWIPAQARLGLLLLPIVLIGMLAAISTPNRTAQPPALRHAGWLLVALATLPLLISSLLFRTIATRYILYAAPFLWALMALHIWTAQRRNRWLGILLLIIALLPFGAGLTHYRLSYVKSDYRAMAETLRARFVPGEEAILLEAPRQHLLAKIYLPRDWPIYPVPAIDLPETWPVTTPPLVPEDEDNRIRAFLRDYHSLWVIYSGENEVDPGEFLAKHLTAVAYRHNCDQWIDLRLCHYIAPQAITPQVSAPLEFMFGQELLLEQAKAALYQPAGEPASLLVQLDWHAVQKPLLDYKVSLRLLNAAGNVVVQEDDFPIGTLLPPTAWSAGDRKPGYMVITLPALPEGDYRIAVEVYDAATGNPVPRFLADTAVQVPSLPVVALLRVDDTMRLVQARADAPGSSS